MGYLTRISENYMYTGILVYVVLAFILFFGITSSNTPLIGGEWSFIPILGLFVTVALSWYFMIIYAFALFIVSIVVVGFLYLLGFKVGIDTVFASIIFFTITGIVIYHLWANGKILREASKNAHGFLRVLLGISGTSYTILALLFIIAIIVLIIGSTPLLTPLQTRTIEIGSLEIDTIVAILGILLSIGKTGLGIIMLSENSKLAKASGILHLLGSAIALTLSYYLLGPLLHLPGTPLEPIEPEHILNYPLPATLLPIFTLQGIIAWIFATYVYA